MADYLGVNPGWLMFHGVDAGAPLHPDSHQPVIRVTSREDYEAWTRWQRLAADEKRAWMLIAGKMHR